MRIAKKKGFAIVIAILVAMVLLVGCSLSKDRKTEGSDNILVVDKAGTYALGDAYEEVIINVPDVQIEDGSVDSILVAESVGDGDVTLRNVKGNELALEGGGPNSIIISGDSEIKSVFIERKDAVIRVLIEDNGVVENATVYEGSQDVVFEGNFGEIIIDASDIEVDIKGAEIDTLSVKGKGTTVRVDKKSSVKSVDILEGADNSRIVFEGIVEKLTIEAKDCTVDINSTAEFIKIEESAKNTTINVGENGSVGVINSTISFTLNGKGIINKVVTNSKSNIKGKATVEEVVLLTNSIPAANLGNTGATIKPASSVAKKETEKTDPKSATQIATVKLDSIAITTPATKTVYTVGETLDITGLVVTGTYSDSTTKVETITTVNVTGFNSSAAVANQTLTVTVGGKIATYKVNINKVVVAVSAITVTGDGPVVNGKTLQMGVDITPTTATNKKVTWSVINGTGSATINSSGLLTATGVGTVTVKALAQDGSGEEGTKEITIKPNDADKVATAKANLGIGHLNDIVENLTLPTTQDDATVLWASSNEGVIATDGTVVRPENSDGNATVTLTATLKVGSATDTKVFVAIVKAKAATQYTLTLTGDNISSAPGAGLVDNNASVTVTVSPAAGKQVASFTVGGADKKSGLVANKYTFTITANTEVVVTYEDIKVTGVILDQATLNLVVGGATETLVATVNPSDAANKAVTWSSSNEAVATVADGVVTPVAAGNATITVTTVDGSFTATCYVTVTVKSSDASLSDLTVDGTTVTDFSKVKTAYDIELPVGTTTIPTVVATVTDTGKANAIVTNVTTLPWKTTVEVTAEDGTKQTYTINFTLNQAAPTGLAGVTPTSVANDDGKITGTTIEMEYKLDTASSWTPATATEVTGLAAGTYNVKYAAKTGYNESPETAVTVGAYTASTDASLSDLKVDGTTITSFNPSTLIYKVELAIGTTTVPTVTATANDSKASAVVTNASSLPGSTTVVVTAEDGATQTYTINFTVATDTTPPVITATDKIVPFASLAAWTGTVSANDDVDGNITSNIVATYFESDGSTSLTDLAAAKTYIGDATTNTSFVVKYNVSDAAGNAATEVVVTITVTEANVPSSMTVGSSILNSTNPYLVDGEPATTGTLGVGNCTAHFDPLTGVLSLQNYVGGEIRIIEAGKDLRIKLIGEANKITGGQFGIYNYSGDIHITSDSEASLEINQNGSSGSATIVTGWGGQGTGSVIISGKAKVKALGITTNGFMNGIQARKDVIIQNEASFDATLKATSNTAWGIYANNIIIDTVGNIDINFSNSTKGYGIYATGKMEIKHVNSMLITLPLTGVASTTNFTTGTVDVLSGVAVNKSTTVASYRSGTPYTLGLEGGNITLATGEVIGSPHQYLVYDEITIQSTISESNFDRWTKADGTELIGSLFTGSTTANSATATIKMPAESLSIKAKVKDTVIDIAAITGVTAPVTGATPLTTPIETAQYTGTVAWSGSPATFAGDTVYTATITLTPKAGYTLTGVAENFFTVDGATTVTNAANTGVVAAVFAKTVALSNDAALTSSIGTVDNTANTIVDVPYATTLEVFKAAITPATGATFKVYQADGTTEATDLASGYKVIVTAQDTTTTKIYTVTVEIGDFAGGLGTVGSPYQVSNAEQLNKVRNYPGNNVYFKQTANIDLSTYTADGGWQPIGNTTTKFAGKYNGNNFNISNLTINRPEADYQGLFGYITYGSVLENISLITVNVEGNNYVGGLVGYFNNGTITSCNVVGTVNGQDDVGGLVGRQAFGTITSSYTSGTVNGTDFVGGLVGGVGSGEDVKVTNSYSLASVEATGINGRVGGLVGLTWKAIENCYAAGKVKGNGTNAGGLVGENKGTITTITSSYYDSTTTDQTDTGKGDGKTTAEMKQAATFTDWDTTIWNIADGSYPTLK